MEGPENKNEPAPEVLAELSALADGTLDPERAAAVRDRIASSPELRTRYEREQRAVAALAIILVLRPILHVIGFAKAFSHASIAELSLYVTVVGTLVLLA